MKQNLRFLAFQLILLSTPILAFAQKGTIRGTIYDNVTGETLIGVTVQVKSTTSGAVTDFDGKFSINIDPGTYDLQISYISYQTIVVSGMVVKAGEVTIIDNIKLKEEVQTLDAVVVTAEAIRNSESALLTVKRKAPNLMDGISSAKFSQIGDSDASDAVKRVTGVSVEGGKYVYVRGLGDRYTKTTLNSVDIPGLDPDRNSIQIDIFPTNLIENMMVLKSSVAEMPADFTGGVVDIETKDFPEERIFNVSASIGYNPSMNLNKDYFLYEGGKTDWMGIDDGTRKLSPLATAQPFPTPGTQGVTDEQVNSLGKSFNKNLSTTNQASFLNYSLGLTFADQKNFKNGHSLGYIFSTSYKNTYSLYDDAFNGEYQIPAASDEYELVYATTQAGTIAERNVLSGTLAGLAYKTNQSKYKLAVMHLQNGESRAARLFIDDNGSAVGKSGYFAGSENLEYNQRGVTNILLNGQHFNNDKTFSVDWKISPTISKIEDPDIRKTAFTYTSSDTVFSSGAAGNPVRIWRYLDEINLVAKVDVKFDYTLLGKPSTLKVGASQTFKERDFSILSYNTQFFGVQPEFNGNAQNVLRDEFLYPNGTVYFTSDNLTPNSNAYNASVSNSAVYISNQFQLLAKLKTVLGLRAENYVMRHTGRDVQGARGEAGGNVLDNEKVLDALDLFPSANLIYSFTDNQNLRFSYSRTIARPSFKEVSYAQILDPVSNRTFNGGLFAYPDQGWDGNIQETRINNFDLRWELFMKKGELLSFSTFYKTFDKPIELVQIYQAQTTSEFQPRNVGDGTVVGVEMEFRKSLDFIAMPLRNVFLSGNVTVIQSQIEMTETEFSFRKTYEKDGQTIERKRQMAGQAPYVINGGLSYENPDMGFDGGFFYNVNGPTLTVVGGSLFPNVFSEPFHSLNFNVNKTIGKNKKSSINFNVSNILNDVREEFYTNFRAADQYFKRLNPGTSFSIGFKYGL